MTSELFGIIDGIAISHETIRRNRQRCLSHLEKGISHKIEESGKNDQLDRAKKLLKHMFFQNRANLKKLGKNMCAVSEIIRGRSEEDVVDIIMEKARSLHGDDPMISSFLAFIKKNRKEVFLYLSNREVEKTLDIVEQHFSIMSSLFKHRFNIDRGLLKTS